MRRFLLALSFSHIAVAHCVYNNTALYGNVNSGTNFSDWTSLYDQSMVSLVRLAQIQLCATSSLPFSGFKEVWSFFDPTTLAFISNFTSS